MRYEFEPVVDYSQYYLRDMTVDADLAGADASHDGVLAVLAGGARIGTGVQWGPVRVTLEVLDEPAPPGLPTGVAAACDIAVPSGVISLSNWDGGSITPVELDRPGLRRLVVRVAGRDEAAEPGGPPEHHELWLYQADGPGPRQRGDATDATGQALRATG